MSAQWLHHLIHKSALELELAHKTIFQFSAKIQAGLSKEPLQDWEADAWARGLKTGLIRLEGYFFRVGSGKRSSLSFFIRNENDLYVGLRREAVTQAATYVSLVTDFGYGRANTCFESQWMDVAVYDETGSALIYAENKAGQKVLEKLCRRLSSEFRNEIPQVDLQAKGVDDALMKASHIWRNRPGYFWGVSPTMRYPFQINYDRNGFTLAPISEIPSIPA